MITCRKCDVPHPNQAAQYPIGGFSGRGLHNDAGQWSTDDNMLWNWICDECVPMDFANKLIAHPGLKDYEVLARKIVETLAAGVAKAEYDAKPDAVAALALAHLACGDLPDSHVDHNDQLWLAFYLGRESMQEGKKSSA